MTSPVSLVDPLLTRQQVAEALNVSVRTVTTLSRLTYNDRRQRVTRLKSVVVGGKLRIRQSELEAFVAALEAERDK